MEVEGVGTAADVDEVPRRRFEQDVGRRVTDFALPTAHDAADGQVAGRVGDEDGVRFQLARRAVEGRHRLARLGQAGVNVNRPVGGVTVGPAAQHVVVKGVVGLAHFEHDVVADIDNDVDRPLSGQPQAVLHPVGAGNLAHALDEQGDEARVKRRLSGGDGDAAVERRPVHDHVIARLAQRATGQRRHLAGHADDRCGPGGVGQDGDLQHGVAPYILERRTGSRGAGEQGSRGGRKRRQILPRSPTPLLPCASQFITPHENNPLVLIANPQLLLGAEHRVIVDAAQRAALELGLDAAVFVAVVEGGPFEGVGGVEILAAQVAAADVG